MAQTFFRLSDNAFNNFPCPAAVLKKWNVPNKLTEDEEGNPLEVTPYTIREAVDAAALGSAPYFSIQHFKTVPPKRGVSVNSITHWILPLNNVGGIIDMAVMPISQAENIPYSEVKLSTDEIQEYLKTGKLPT